MTEHYFKTKTEVVCAKTGGSFDKVLWAQEKVSQGKCPCCNEVCKFKEKKK